jgi:hypothetical protein
MVFLVLLSAWCGAVYVIVLYSGDQIVLRLFVYFDGASSKRGFF